MAETRAAEREGGVKVVVTNRRARFEYEILDTVEAGIVLTGTEVKSARNSQIQLADAFAIVRGGEVFLVGVHIAEYAFGNRHNHDPRRERKLLLHKLEIEKLRRRVEEKGFTLVPLRMYFKRARLKVELGVCRGKRLHDKREAIRERDDRREIARVHKHGGRDE